MNDLNKRIPIIKNRPSLVGSLTKTLFIGLILVFVAMSLLVSLYGSHVLKSITNERLSYILSTQSASVAQLLWDLETDQIQTTLKNIVKDKNISAVRVSEIVGGKKTVVEEYHWQDGLDTLTQDIIYTYDTGETRLLGVLEIAVDYKSIERQVYTIILVSALLFGTIFLLLGALVYYTLHRGINPITELSESLIDADYFTHEIKISKSNAKEIHDLFSALSTMQTIMQRQTREIRDQKNMLDTIIDKMPLGIYVEDISNDEKLIIANGMFKKLFDIKNVETDGMKISDILCADDANLMKSLNGTVQKDKKLFDVPSYRAKTPKNSFIARILKTPILDKDQNITHIVTMVQDVTEQEEAHDNLMTAKDLAEKANKTKSEFLANMSHELRTPMNSIIGLTHIMIDDKDTPDEHLDMLSTVSKSSNLLLDIVNDILDLSKIEADGLTLENIPFDLKEKCGAVISTLKPIAQEKSLDFLSAWESDFSPAVLGDPTRFMRIIINLGSNAIKFTMSGHVKLSFNVTNPEEDIINFVCVVEDTGIGIAEDKVDYIFDKFSQADDSTTRKFGGTGLGLAITRQLIELMGGSIHLKSEVGKGSVFTITVPFKTTERSNIITEETNQTSQSLVDDAEKKPIKNIRVLIAEDHQMNQILLKKMLPRLGIENYLIMPDGKEALSAYKNDSYDLIIMDCHMPEMNGYDTTQKIRQHEKNNNLKYTPIIAMTADAMVGTRDKCIQAGMDDYISKPVDAKKLTEILKKWFQIEN